MEEEDFSSVEGFFLNVGVSLVGNRCSFCLDYFLLVGIQFVWD